MWFDDYGAYDDVGEFDSLVEAREFAKDYEDENVCDPYGDGCVILDENGKQYSPYGTIED